MRDVPTSCCSRYGKQGAYQNLVGGGEGPPVEHLLEIFPVADDVVSGDLKTEIGQRKK